MPPYLTVLCQAHWERCKDQECDSEHVRHTYIHTHTHSRRRGRKAAWGAIKQRSDTGRQMRGERKRKTAWGLGWWRHPSGG